MIQEGIRPIRKPLNGNEDIYENIELLFNDTYTEMDSLKRKILDTIEFLDYNKSCKVFVIVLENMTEVASSLLHQCDIWRQKAKLYSTSPELFDAEFEGFTKI